MGVRCVQRRSIREVLGAGLLIGIALTKENSGQIATALQSAGILVNAANPNTIRIAPALTISRVELKKFVSIFKDVMAHEH